MIPEPPGIMQSGLPPYTMRCMVCGATWDPAPPKGKKELTDHRLDAEAERHWKECPVSQIRA